MSNQSDLALSFPAKGRATLKERIERCLADVDLVSFPAGGWTTLKEPSRVSQGTANWSYSRRWPGFVEETVIG